MLDSVDTYTEKKLPLHFILILQLVLWWFAYILGAINQSPNMCVLRVPEFSMHSGF